MLSCAPLHAASRYGYKSQSRASSSAASVLRAFFFGVGASLLALRPRRARLVFGCRARLACALVASFTNKIGVLYHLRGKPLGDVARARASRTPSSTKRLFCTKTRSASPRRSHGSRAGYERARERKKEIIFLRFAHNRATLKKAQAYFFSFRALL